MSVSIGPQMALAFGLLFARAGGITLGLPPMLGVSLPVQLRVLLALLLAAALMPRATVSLPVAPGALPVVILMTRELVVGVTLAFAAALVVGAATMAGDLCGTEMELNTGALLRGSVEMPNVAADAFGTLAGVLFFIGGFHRWLLLALARSLEAEPLGRLALPSPESLVVLGGRIFSDRARPGPPDPDPALHPRTHAGRDRAARTAGQYPDRRASRDPSGRADCFGARCRRIGRRYHARVVGGYDASSGVTGA